jgi:histidyl-tRNA synthetase
VSDEPFPSVKGMPDHLPPEAGRLDRIVGVSRRVLRAYGYRVVVTPVVEYTELFARAVGQATDLVEKEMYTFPDRDGRSLSLRPEGTAGAVRAYIQHAVHKAEPMSKWFYAGPMFRHERQQRGRYRQFHQVGAEALGIAEPAIDAEMVTMLVDLLAELGVPGTRARLSSLGCAACRPAYREKLTAFLRPRAADLCDDCRRRLETNPLRVLDCKKEGCTHARSGAPSTLDVLCTECRAHLDAVVGDLVALRVPHQLDGTLARGLDYYTRTTFEIVSDAGELGAQNALLGGGRYDALVEELGGPSVPAIGFAMGVERVLLAVPAEAAGPAVDVFLVALGEPARRRLAATARELRAAGLRVDLDHRGGSAKRQLRRADSLGARLVVLAGDDELARGTVALKDLRTGQQREVAQPDLAAEISRALQGAPVAPAGPASGA